MADYSRFIAYIYEYVNGMKQYNAGFTKVEVRNGICKIQLVMKNTGRESKVRIYGLVRTEEWLLGILLGEGQVQRQRLDVRIVTDSEKIGGSDYPFQKITGLFIQGAEGRIYATAWDEEPLFLEKFVTELPKEEPKLQAAELEVEDTMNTFAMTSCQKDNKNKEEAKVDSDCLLCEGEKSEMTTLIERSEQILEDREREEQKISEMMEKAENNERRKEEEEQGKDKIQQREEEDEEAQREKEETKEEEKIQVQEGEAKQTEKGEEEQKQREYLMETEEKLKQKDAGEQEQTKGKKLARQNVDRQEIREGDVEQPRVKKTQEERWKTMVHSYPQIDPFEDDEICECIQISPRDLMMIWQKEWRLGRNSFLLHGYYNYRHLIFGRTKEGNWILGVPGVYERQEHFVASRFGFAGFKPAKTEKKGEKPFGYWYRVLV